MTHGHEHEHEQGAGEEASQEGGRVLQPRTPLPLRKRGYSTLSPPQSAQARGIGARPLHATAVEVKGGLSRATLDSISDAWAEAAEAAEQDRAKLEQELAELRAEHSNIENPCQRDIEILRDST